MKKVVIIGGGFSGLWSAFSARRGKPETPNLNLIEMLFGRLKSTLANDTNGNAADLRSN